MMLPCDRQKGEVNFFIREPWKSFNDFISDLVTLLFVQQKVFINDFWEVSVLSKCFQSLRIELSVILYSNLLWLAVGKSSLLQNMVEEIKPVCRNLQRSQTMVNLSEISLGGMILKIQSGVWV